MNAGGKATFLTSVQPRQKRAYYLHRYLGAHLMLGWFWMFSPYVYAASCIINTLPVHRWFVMAGNFIYVNFRPLPGTAAIWVLIFPHVEGSKYTSITAATCNNIMHTVTLIPLGRGAPSKFQYFSYNKKLQRFKFA